MSCKAQSYHKLIFVATYACAYNKIIMIGHLHYDRLYGMAEGTGGGGHMPLPGPPPPPPPPGPNILPTPQN